MEMKELFHEYHQTWKNYRTGEVETFVLPTTDEGMLDHLPQAEVVQWLYKLHRESLPMALAYVVTMQAVLGVQERTIG